MNLETSAMALIICKNQILSIKEEIKENLCLSLPKGHLEENETLLECAIREAYEETGITITKNDFIKVLDSYNYSFTWNDKLITKTIYPHLFEIKDLRELKISEKNINSAEFIDIDQFIKECTYQNLSKIVFDLTKGEKL